jgi:predicted DNA binding CopG/RHH family protein
MGRCATVQQGEAAFWAENRLELRLMEQAVAASSESAESVAITLRIDPRMLSKLKRLARSRYLNYQSMIKQWLSERLEQELRERERGVENRGHKLFS